MALKENLMQDLKVAMKEKNKLQKSVITMLRAAIKQVEVDKREDLDDEAIIEIIAKQIKQKKGAIVEFEKGGRDDLVTEAKDEIEVLMKYLPEQLSEEAVVVLVKEAIEATQAQTMKDMGKVMGYLAPKTKGKADNSMVSSLVRQSLQ